MRRFLPIPPLLALLLAGAACAAPPDDQDEARRLRAAGAIVPLEQLTDVASRLHPGRVLEAELKRRHDRYIYEIELLDEAGVVREMVFDAASGRLLDERTDE